MSEKRTTDTEEQPNKPRRWRPTMRQALWAFGLVLVAAVFIACVVAIRTGHRLGYVPLVIVVLLILIRTGYRYEWTGFRETSRPKDEKREIQPRKTLWDWMQLLFVPAMLAILAGGLTWWQTSSERARQAEEVARQEALRAQNTAVQGYLDQMTTLLLEKNLRGSDVDSEVRTIAQARTSAVLQVVEPENQRTLLQFLSDASLIQRQLVEERPPIISLDRVDLSDSDLRNIELNGSNLSLANLSFANLRGAYVMGADLSETNLSNANLNDANLDSADLAGADLSDANLERANLERANLDSADLAGADLSGANLRDAYLAWSFLRNAKLKGANLQGANLSGDVDLSNADLRGANLSDATTVTEEQLEKQTELLEGATMPDGSVHP